MSTERIEYRGFIITFDPPPIPTRAYDWRWMSDDYDGAPDSTDTRAGRSASLADAKADVNAWWDEYENGNSQLQFETEMATAQTDSYDDSQTLASAGMVEEP